MQAQMQVPPPPMGLTASTLTFGVFSILLWLTVVAVIPWLRDTFGILPIIGWYITGTAFVLVPVMFFGCVMAWRELPKHDPGALRRRLRLKAMDRGDVIWAIGGLFTIATASAAILALARYIDASFRPSPWFLLRPPASTPGYLRPGFRCLSATSWVRNCAGAVTFCLVRRQDSAEPHG